MAKPQTTQKIFLPLIAGLSAGVFFFAINSCNAEALIPHAHADQSHQHASSEDQHDHRTAPAHDDASLCCTTIQAIAASKLNVQLSPLTKWLLVSLDVQSLGTSLLVESAGLTSGLSPPPRTTIPALPFYRTTYASLAPPAHLA